MMGEMTAGLLDTGDQAKGPRSVVRAHTADVGMPAAQNFLPNSMRDAIWHSSLQDQVYRGDASRRKWRRRGLAKIQVDHQHRRPHLRGVRADAPHGE
jgi:hypothetical protein